ncbi:MAG TPA: N-acetylmuramoyl-L-alanine amidase, partial [Rubricoccaceae bacterium]
MSRLVLAVLLVTAAGCSGSAPRGGFGADPRPAPPRALPPRPAALPTPLPPLPEAVGGLPSAAAVASLALVRPLDAPTAPAQGLAGRHVAVWPSHGWYYEPSRGTWEWQRAHLFTTIEDVLPASIVLPYLAPMLERAGAVVLMPRERDTQTDEAVVDADVPAGTDGRRGTAEEAGDWRPGGTGYGHRATVRTTQNPFASGTSRVATTALVPTARMVWTADIAAPGEYAVTVAYTSAPDRATDARYTVQHAGGTTRVAVNQRIGGGTWVRLGTFRFAPGRARVTLSNESATPGRTVSADAVRWGGGMGTVQRGGETGGRPRWTEAARYYEQFAGLPNSVYSPEPEDRGDDYKDDYKSRGEWVNALVARGVPIDVALALHTDAGLTTDSTAVGTLAIYSSRGPEGEFTFPDGRPRRASRDFAARLQSQIVGDVRALYDPLWTQRDLRDRTYAEAARPGVPSALIELLSHQNLTDMRFALDPRFRHDVARALYKGIGRFVAAQRGAAFVVQPLPPDGLSALFDAAGNVVVRWTPVIDRLEPSAAASGAVVYTRLGEGGWDSGRAVRGTEVVLAAPPPGVVLSVRVASVNGGGESAPSEVL